MTQKYNYLVLKTIVTLASLYAAGCNSGEEASSQKSYQIVRYGDSITRRGGLYLKDYLPAGSTVDNRGFGGQTCQQATDGQFGDGTSKLTTFEQDLASIPKTSIIVIGFGTNEALQAVSVASYIACMNGMISIAKNYRVVIEAPPQILNPQANAPEFVKQYNSSLHNLPALIVDGATNVPLDPDEIHPTDEGYKTRAKLLAESIVKTY